MLKRILNEIRQTGYVFNSDCIVSINNTIAGTEEEDFYTIIDYLEDNNIKYQRDKRSMTGLWMLEVKEGL